MEIILSSDSTSGVDDVQDWLHFNSLPFQSRAFWDDELMMFRLGPDIENSTVVWNHVVMRDFFTTDASWPELRDFFRRGNRLWVLGWDFGAALTPKMSAYWHMVKRLDSECPRDSVTFFIDTEPSDRCCAHDLANIRVRSMPANFFMREPPRIEAASAIKSQARYDYLLTMVRKRYRPHRAMIYRELISRPGLLERGLVSYRTSSDQPWIGRSHRDVAWKGSFPSMDLYLDCWLEVVPETCYRDHYFLTEKVRKPMITHTPFLVISTAGYLDFLRRNGFRTFHGLIDEGYDLHPRVEDRIGHMIDTLADISATGAQDFYEASQDILRHNFARLCEIAGSWRHDFDSMMWQEYLASHP